MHIQFIVYTQREISSGCGNRKNVVIYNVVVITTFNSQYTREFSCSNEQNQSQQLDQLKYSISNCDNNILCLKMSSTRKFMYCNYNERFQANGNSGCSHRKITYTAAVIFKNLLFTITRNLSRVVYIGTVEILLRRRIKY